MQLDLILSPCKYTVANLVATSRNQIEFVSMPGELGAGIGPELTRSS